MATKLIAHVDPQYTEQARQAKLQGTVVLRVDIDETGVPRNIAVITPLGLGLDQSAIQAVEQWRFSPTLLNNVPVSVETTVEVNFKLL
jgi:TonB family protein